MKERMMKGDGYIQIQKDMHLKKVVEELEKQENIRDSIGSMG